MSDTTETDAEFAEARRLCEVIGGRPQEIRMGASRWVYVQLSLTEARHLAAWLAEHEATT